MSTDLLADLAALRDRTRGDRRAFAFPLFLFGGLILLSPLVYVPRHLPVEWINQGVDNDLGPFPPFVPHLAIFLEYPALVGWYWMATIIGGLLLTAWWYRRHARRHGVEADVRGAAAAAGAALFGLVLWEPLLSDVWHDLADVSLRSTPEVNLPILFGSAALSATACYLAGRATGTRRTAATAAGAFLAAVAFGSIGVYLLNGYAALLVIGAVLVGLAWWERSTVLLGVAVAFLAVSAPSIHGNALGLYGQTTMLGDDPRPAAFFSVLAPAVVLLAGGVLAMIRNRR